MPELRSFPFQPQMVPSSDANRKLAGEPFDNANPGVELNTVPVGCPGFGLDTAGITALKAVVPFGKVT
ncbi:MAG: hypothetical protein ABI197_09090 [Granulicella sp.]